MRWWWGLLCSRVGVLIVLAHWNNNPRVDMSLHSGHIILIPSQPILMLRAEKQQIHTNVIVFGLNRPGLEPTIYHTRDEHAYHYATDAVKIQMNLLVQSNILKFHFTFIDVSFNFRGETTVWTLQSSIYRFFKIYFGSILFYKLIMDYIQK